MKKTHITSLLLLLMFSSLFASGVAEIQQLETDSTSKNPITLMQTVHLLEISIDSIVDTYQHQFDTQVVDIQKSFSDGFIEISALEAHIWEPSDQFSKRVEEETEALTLLMDTQIDILYNSLVSEVDDHLFQYLQWQETALTTLNTIETISPYSMHITWGEYQRNERIWPLSVSFSSNIMSFTDVMVSVLFQEKEGSVSKNTPLFIDSTYIAISDDVSSLGLFELVYIEVRDGRMVDVDWDAFDGEYDYLASNITIEESSEHYSWYEKASRVSEALNQKQYYPLSFTNAEIEKIENIDINTDQLYSLIIKALNSGLIEDEQEPLPIDNTIYLRREYTNTSSTSPLTNENTITHPSEINDFEKAIEEEKLTLSITYHIVKDPLDGGTFTVEILSLTLKNLVNEIEYSYTPPIGLITQRYKVSGTTRENVKVREVSIIRDALLENPLSITPTLSVTPIITFEPQNILDASYSFSIEDENIASIEGDSIIAGDAIASTILTLHANNGFTKDFNIDVEYKVGDAGPSSGYIFYDEGNYDKGVRYLEVSLNELFALTINDEKSVYSFSGDDKRPIPLETRDEVFSGKENTALIASFYESEENVAQMCLDYSMIGVDDWHLPSKDELSELISFITTHFGEYYSLVLDGMSYWTSTHSLQWVHGGVKK